MKQIFTFVVLLIISSTSFAQLPHVINYQGVARNSQGVALANQPVKVRASLIKEYDGMTTTTFFTETRSLTTNQLGLFSFKLNDGSGSTTTGSFEDGGWLHPVTKQFLKIELDVNNSGTFVDMGTQQIVSVPYAVYADRATTADELTAKAVAFNAVSNISQSVPGGFAPQKITFESLNTGSTGFDLAADEYTVPVSGMYQINLKVFGNFASPTSGYTRLALFVNGTEYDVAFHNITSTFTHASLSVTVYLTAGVKLSAYLQHNASTLTLGAEYTSFSGHLIR